MKFQTKLAEKAHSVSLDGFLVDEFGSVDHGGYWHGLVDVDGVRVWIREDTFGFVDEIESSSLTDTAGLEERWEWARHEEFLCSTS